VGLLVDLAVGEVPTDPHPIAALGAGLGWLEGRTYRDARLAGVVHAALGLTLGMGAGGLLGRSALATTTATWVASSGRMLGDEARRVTEPLHHDDLTAARAALPSLVGRDPSGLDASGVARAVIESVAENTVDAVVAPACWGALAGAAGVLGHRAVNTLDAMVGHRSARYERFGWASARLDDVAAWVPARLTVALVCVARPRRAGEVVRTVRRDAGAHPSPNGGQAEAAFAAALGLQLGGTNRYGTRVEERGLLGTGRPPEAGDVDAAVRLLREVTLVLAGALVAVDLAASCLRRGRVRRG